MPSIFSNKIQIDLIDQSISASPEITEVMGTVVKASRGSLEPVYFPKNSKAKILQVLGNYSSTYPGVWDVIEANKQSEIWVSAPSLNGLYGGILVTKTGSEPFVSGQTSMTGLDFSAIEWEESLGTGNGVATNFTVTVDDFAHYENQSIDILVDGVSINVTASDAATEILSTSPNVGTGTFIRATGVLDFTFSSAPASGEVITVTYTVDRSADAYFALYNKAPQADNKAAKITYASGIFTANLYEKSGTTYTPIIGSPYEMSLTAGTTNAKGRNVYIANTLDGDYYFNYVINTDLAVSTFVDDTTQVDFAGGDRGDSITLTQLTAGWAYFQSVNTYAVDIFFDTTSDAGIPAIADTLVDPEGSFAKYSSFILPLPQANVATSVSTKAGYSIDNRNIAFYWNWGYVTDDINGGSFLSNLVGRVAVKYAQMQNVFNALQPANIDENNHGGQLGSGIQEMLYDIGEDDQTTLEDANINPILFDKKYGVTITKARTSISVNSDYRSIGHSRLANYIISNVVNLVLPFQLLKLNDVAHRAKIVSQCRQILDPLLADPYNVLNDFLVVCDETNNGPEVLNAEELHLAIYVIFTAFSEKIVFTFSVNENGVNLQETFG